MSKTISAMAVLATAFVASQAMAQDKIELKATTFVPPTHFFATSFLEPWAADIAKRTGGKVSIRVYAGNSPLGNVANQDDQVEAGVTDVAFGQNAFPPGRHPRTLILSLPFMGADSYSGSMTLWSMRDSHLAEDFKGFKVLGLLCGKAFGIFTRDKKAERFEDLRGLRIRTISPQSQAALQHIGAVPVALPAGQIYESLEKGILDGAMMGYDGLVGFRVERLVKYYFAGNMFVSCFQVVMNQKKFDSLPSEAKKAIDETTGDAWISPFVEEWEKSHTRALKIAGERGVVEVLGDPQARAKWREQFKPVIDQQLAELEKQGITNARAMYEEMLKRVAHYTK